MRARRPSSSCPPPTPRPPPTRRVGVWPPPSSPGCSSPTRATATRAWPTATTASTTSSPSTWSTERCPRTTPSATSGVSLADGALGHEALQDQVGVVAFDSGQPVGRLEEGVAGAVGADVDGHSLHAAQRSGRRLVGATGDAPRGGRQLGGRSELVLQADRKSTSLNYSH